MSPGDRVGRFEVVWVATNRGLPCAMVECDCGEQLIILLETLRQGQVQSCGCQNDLAHARLILSCRWGTPERGAPS